MSTRIASKSPAGLTSAYVAGENNHKYGHSRLNLPG
jgi:hypothetical protein